AFDGNEIYQNGGILGLTATAYKGNFFTALTANVGMHGANIKTDVGNNDFNTLTTGVASKTGYNWELADGKFIVQPSWMMSYTFINPFDDYTLGNGVRIKNDSLHALQLAPGLKFIGNTPNGWQPYLGAQMVWNIIDDSKVKANEVNLPETSTKAYVEYGVGVQKSAGERFTGFGQAMVRNGGRTGVIFTLGGRWAIGTLNR
ncbi:MAG: autotransporter outer membrane beta-barrel domain-containing protein, partial [bacterium]|nr:autotransporter outer membrane beta-barrel domain-containing protein [bacterium]